MHFCDTKERLRKIGAWRTAIHTIVAPKLLGCHCPRILLLSIQPPHTLLSPPVSSTCPSHFFLVHPLLVSFISGKEKKNTHLCNHATSLHFCSVARSAESDRLEKKKESLRVSHPITTESDEQGGKVEDKATRRDGDGREDRQCLHVKRGCAKNVVCNFVQQRLDASEK